MLSHLEVRCQGGRRSTQGHPQLLSTMDSSTIAARHDIAAGLRMTRNLVQGINAAPWPVPGVQNGYIVPGLLECQCCLQPRQTRTHHKDLTWRGPQCTAASCQQSCDASLQQLSTGQCAVHAGIPRLGDCYLTPKCGGSAVVPWSCSLPRAYGQLPGPATGGSDNVFFLQWVAPKAIA